MPSERASRRDLLIGLGLGLGLAAALPLVPPALAANATVDAARALVQEVGDQVLAVMQDDSLDDRQKFHRLVDLLEGPIDLDLVARLILGRHWRTADQAQQERYLGLFRTYALDNLANRLHLFQGEEFQITGARAAGANDAVVATRIRTAEGRPLQVDWRLRDRDNGEIVAIDVIVEGVSLIVSLRSEFGSVIERRGMDGLLAELQRRIDELEA
jgi:phospholipid transport system substrate-binding protein